MATRATADTPVSACTHSDTAAQRPDIGIDPQFTAPSRTYRYDSSRAPELQWDETPECALAEWLLSLIIEAAERGESTVFATPQVWHGASGRESYASTRQCAAHLRRLTRPFLNWEGKTERQAVTVPALPLFVHERHSTQAIPETPTEHRASGTTCDLFGFNSKDISADARVVEGAQQKLPRSNRSNSPFRYPGGKFYARRMILAEIPPHSVYAEPFCGGASVFFAKDNAKISMLNDRDEEVINTLRQIRDRVEGLIGLLDGIPATKQQHNFYKNHYQPTCGLTRALRWFYLNRTSYSGIMRPENCYWGYGHKYSNAPGKLAAAFADGVGPIARGGIDRL